MSGGSWLGTRMRPGARHPPSVTIGRWPSGRTHGRTALLVAKGLCKHFEGAERDVLSAVDLPTPAMPRDCGPHGWAVTLLYLLGLLDQATDGELLWDGAAASALSEDALFNVVRTRSGSSSKITTCSAMLCLDNVLVPLLPPRGAPRAPDGVRPSCWSAWGAEILQHRPHQLSTGQRQRVATAPALMGDWLLLADEPTGLDTESARQLMALLEHARGIAMVVATHDLVLAEQVGRVHRLEDGRLVAT